MPAGASPGPGSAGEVRMTFLPPLEDAARVSCFLADQPLVMYVSRDAKCRLALTPLKFTTTRYR